MSKFRSHTIVHLSPMVDMKIDPTLEGSLQRVFEWANEMGMKGHLVRGLTFVPPEVSIGLLVGGQLKCLIPIIEDDIDEPVAVDKIIKERGLVCEFGCTEQFRVGKAVEITEDKIETYLCRKCETKATGRSFEGEKWPCKGWVWQKCYGCDFINHCNWVEFDPGKFIEDV